MKEREEKKRYKTEDEADDAMTDDATTLNMEEDKFQDECEPRSSLIVPTLSVHGTACFRVHLCASFLSRVSS